jgi:hypothetical protein
MSLIQNWQLSDSYGMEIPGADKSTKERRFPIAMLSTITVFFQPSLSGINSKTSFGLHPRILQSRSNV